LTYVFVLKPVEGNPDPEHPSASYAEPAKLTIRMHLRRLTRLTNGFSKKIVSHDHSVALLMTYFVLRTPPLTPRDRWSRIASLARAMIGCHCPADRVGDRTVATIVVEQA
jgi:hypothetical protein